MQIHDTKKSVTCNVRGPLTTAVFCHQSGGHIHQHEASSRRRGNGQRSALAAYACLVALLQERPIQADGAGCHVQQHAPVGGDALLERKGRRERRKRDDGVCVRHHGTGIAPTGSNRQESGRNPVPAERRWTSPAWTTVRSPSSLVIVNCPAGMMVTISSSS